MLLDQLAAEHEGRMDDALRERAAQLGLKWRSDCSETAKPKHRDDYTCEYERRKLTLGPHVVVANGTGAGRNCRIYAHVADGRGEVERGIYVCHIGRHLPDSTTG